MKYGAVPAMCSNDFNCHVNRDILAISCNLSSALDSQSVHLTHIRARPAALLKYRFPANSIPEISGTCNMDAGKVKAGAFHEIPKEGR